MRVCESVWGRDDTERDLFLSPWAVGSKLSPLGQIVAIGPVAEFKSHLCIHYTTSADHSTGYKHYSQQGTTMVRVRLDVSSPLRLLLFTCTQYCISSYRARLFLLINYILIRRKKCIRYESICKEASPFSRIVFTPCTDLYRYRSLC